MDNENSIAWASYKELLKRQGEMYTSYFRKIEIKLKMAELIPVMILLERELKS